MKLIKIILSLLILSGIAFTQTNSWVDLFPNGNTLYGIKHDGSIWAWGNSQGSLLGFEIPPGKLDEPVLQPTQLGTENKWLKHMLG